MGPSSCSNQEDPSEPLLIGAVTLGQSGFNALISRTQALLLALGHGGFDGTFWGALADARMMRQSCFDLFVRQRMGGGSTCLNGLLHTGVGSAVGHCSTPPG